MLEQARRFHQTGNLAEAERAYQQILQANGQDAEVWYQLGDAVLGQGRRGEEQGRLDEALAGYQMQLWLQPDSESAHWNRALAWLQKGDFTQGWQEYEWRWIASQAGGSELTVEQGHMPEFFKVGSLDG